MILYARGAVCWWDASEAIYIYFFFFWRGRGEYWEEIALAQMDFTNRQLGQYMYSDLGDGAVISKK